MDFLESVQAVEALLGKTVEVVVFGPGEDSCSLATMSGVLRRAGLDEPAPILSDIAGVVAVSFGIGGEPYTA